MMILQLHRFTSLAGFVRDPTAIENFEKAKEALKKPKRKSEKKENISI